MDKLTIMKGNIYAKIIRTEAKPISTYAHVIVPKQWIGHKVSAWIVGKRDESETGFIVKKHGHGARIIKVPSDWINQTIEVEVQLENEEEMK
jgi:hypothetical protein